MDFREAMTGTPKKQFYKVILGGAVALGVIYFGGLLYFGSHFLPGSKIAGIPVGGMSVKAATEKVKKEAEDYNLTLHFRDGADTQLDQAALGYEFVDNGSVEAAKDMQMPFLWFASALHGSDYRAGVTTSYSSQEIEAAVKQIPQLQTENMTEPESAKLAFEDGSFVVKEPVDGSKLDQQQVLEAVIDAVKTGETELNVDSEGLYVTAPEVGQEELAQQAKVLNETLMAKITYDLPDDKTFVLDGSTMVDWLVKAENGDYYKDDEVWEEHLVNFVADLASKIDTVGDSQNFNATGLGTITIDTGGLTGWLVNQEAEADKLRQELSGGVMNEREPRYLSRGDGTAEDNYGFGDTYVEIDLSRQHLWLYYGGSLMVETDIVSGNMADGHETPAGVFHILDKQTDATLKGDIQMDGSFGYQSAVKYWMPITASGVGLHDASWRWEFGGSIYQYNGSHGCINLPPEVAGQIFNLVDGSLPVIVYYS